MISQCLFFAHVLLAPLAIPLQEVKQLEPTTTETTRLYLVRHGESLFNLPDENGITYTSGKSLAVPLTEKGLSQARHLGEQLAEKFPSGTPIVILSSAALRAQQTAQCLFAELGKSYPVELGESDEGLCELGQGKWEGEPKDLSYEEALAPWEALSAADKFVTPKLPTGESYQAVAKRAFEALSKAIEQYKGKTLFIVSHFVALNAMALEWNGGTDQLSRVSPSKLPSVILDNCDMLLVEVPLDKGVEQSKVALHLKAACKPKFQAD